MPNSTKILYIITQGEMGGAQRYVFDLVGHLPTNYEAITAVGRGSGHLEQTIKSKSKATIQLKYLVRNINPIYDLLAIFEIASLVRKLQPNIVHLNSSKAGFIGSIGARLGGCRNIIFTAHGFAFLEPHNWLVKKLYFWAEKFAMRYRNTVITVSDYDKKAALALALGPENKFVTIHNGITKLDSDFIPKPEAKSFLQTRFGFSLSSPTIGTIANLYPTKGLTYLMRSMPDVLRVKPNAQLVIIGEGQQRRKLEQEIHSLQLSKQIKLVGRLPEAQKYLKAFEIYVQSSLKEGLPYTILEAANAGVPIVSTDVGGIPEILQNNISAILVKPKNSKALANKISTLLEDGEFAKQLGQRAQTEIKKFTTEEMVNQTTTEYLKLLTR